MIRSTCGYLIRDGQWLMLYRNKKKDDVNQGKWIGVGGKLKDGETPEQCMIRETYEETGLICDTLCFCGIVYFIYEERETEKIWVYTVNEFHGELAECREGTLAWIPQDQISGLPLWEGDRLFLNRLQKPECLPFTLFLYYDDKGNLLKASEENEENYE